jgi:S-methylmethionine-dependent homocysteine/selenocysteine methylase
MTCDVTEEEYGSFALQWQREGASIIGGCCGTTPGYIRGLVEALSNARRSVL